MSRLLSDVQLALRSWRKAPALTAIVIASIGLGIGANASIFTLVDQVLLRSLPVHEPHQLVQVTRSGGFYGSSWGDGSELSYPMYEHLRDHQQVFEGMFGRFTYAVHFAVGDRTERVTAELVSGTYFPLLRVQPALGRTLLPEDDGTPGAPAVVVLGHAFWTSRFAADPSVIGRTAIVNDHTYTIVGVARPGFEGIELGRAAQIFVPITMKAQITPGWNGLDDARFSWVRVFARLQPGVTSDQAAAALQPLYRTQIEHEVAQPAFANASDRAREMYLANEVRLLPGGQGRSNFRRALTTPLWVLMAIAAGVLLIACANVANLLLARAAGRRKEMAIRIALGATRGRLAGQLLVESTLLALAGGVAGIFIAMVGAPLLLGYFVSPDSPAPISTTPDFRIVAFTFSLSALTGILFGLAPAIQSSRPTVTPALKDEAGSVAGGHARFRKALVASQVAVSLLLIVGAALFLRTLDNLLAVDVGFRTESLISFSVDPSNNGYGPERARQFARTLLQQLEETPGVTGAGLSVQRLLDGNQWNGSVTVEGYAPGEEGATAWFNAIGPGYFRAMGIPVLRGREFTDADARATPPADGAPAFRVAIANQTFVQKYVQDREPIGRRVALSGDPGAVPTIEIVGVVRDAKYTNVRDETQPQLFFPYLEQARPLGFTMYVRTSEPPDAMFATIRRTVQTLDPHLPVYSTRTLERQVQQSLRNERMTASLSAVFGSLATLLAVVGLYGVMSYTVSRRTREIGVRMALGAGSGRIARMVVAEVLWIAGAGVAIGLPLVWWLARYVESQLYGVEAGDLPTLVTAVGIVAAVALLAGLVPSTRAARVEPTMALRCE